MFAALMVLDLHPLRMNVAPNQTIILGLQIFLDHRSLSSIDQKILMTLNFQSLHHSAFLSFPLFKERKLSLSLWMFIISEGFLRVPSVLIRDKNIL